MSNSLKPGKLMEYGFDEKSGLILFSKARHILGLLVGDEKSAKFKQKFYPNFNEESERSDLAAIWTTTRILILEVFNEREYRKVFFGEETPEFEDFWDSEARVLKILTPKHGIKFVIFTGSEAARVKTL